MASSAATFLARGAFADVFDLHDGTVAKVYRRSNQTHSQVIQWDDHEFLIRQLFAQELLTYQKIQTEPELIRFVPQFHGPFDCIHLDLPTSQPSEPLMLDCALRIEKLNGKDRKLAHLESPLQQDVEELLERIRDKVPDVNVWDASCFVPGRQAEFCVIDFALWEHLVDLQCYLDENGSLPQQLRDQFRVTAA